MKFGTKILHGEGSIDKNTGALSTPIYQTSTYHQFDIENFGKYDYSRSANPTREVLENSIAELEGGKYGYAFSSGMAAISSVLSIFSTGDHIIVCGDVYGGTYRAVTQLFSRFNIEFTFVDASENLNIKNAIKENTKAIYLETPSNPLLKIIDLKASIKLAKECGAVVIVDNTFMSPYLQRPLELGADIVVHSATKFIGGHSDVIAGLAVTRDEAIGKRIYQIQNTFGAILGPQDCWLILRGLKTLKVRMKESQKNAEELASWLEDREEVEAVYYPGLDSHKGKDIHFSQAYGGGAVLSFKLKNLEKTTEFLNKVTNVAVAVSLGAVETIVSYPVKMSHASIPKEEREKLGVTDTLIRVSLGIEDIEDIIKSFEDALVK
ncbi:aminotransferase class V-fold PLP-dependent enzyme [Clostridium gasigenes]|uniref:trans-sulfuration enzyme family protein n=1 Tax=Clostridium gasigenes TaxID=94869 RepID=UPI00143843A8|nr:aminotransferase class V-fold PLP-dependent enzyme [Clostridium gasigenes]NKF07805.1 aminotransferase class V-fold PLP-dependent enzyme [Clostridium gasigenes]QSW20427.1 aminotransferase class V-fold PLP-dependent enzyme [Clostridium gasigenes]